MPNNLIEFSNAVINNANTEKQYFTKKLTDKNLALINERKKALETECSEYIKKETLRLENEKTIAISMKQALNKKMLIEKRSELADSLFEQIETKLYEYTKTKEYYSRLKTDFLSASAKFTEGETLVYARECDLEFLRNTSNLSNFIYKPCGDSIIGGFTILNKKMRLLLDYTLRTGLTQEKQNFALNSGLIIEGI